ncbi:MAG: hypothetical protein F4129_13835 [Acidimicrobiia bacterium]|nr:hypothetical protein [Acidimicrobiia bacterium]MYL10544.1 hypothetical protein [Acidimicrobiia bacterium]
MAAGAGVDAGVGAEVGWEVDADSVGALVGPASVGSDVGASSGSGESVEVSTLSWSELDTVDAAVGVASADAASVAVGS